MYIMRSCNVAYVHIYVHNEDMNKSDSNDKISLKIIMVRIFNYRQQKESDGTSWIFSSL